MKCPICNVDLLMSEKQGVDIDYCPQCRGIWLDRGDLEKIVDRSIQTSGKKILNNSVDDYEDEKFKKYAKHDNHEGYKKKAGWKDLFDF
jgi:Zn-finger nucleic acid-binding protein